MVLRRLIRVATILFISFFLWDFGSCRSFRLEFVAPQEGEILPAPADITIRFPDRFPDWTAIVLNGIEVTHLAVHDGEWVSIPADEVAPFLVEGDNRLIVSARSGDLTLPIEERRFRYDAAPPEVHVTSVTPGEVEGILQVEGYATDTAGVSEIRVNALPLELETVEVIGEAPEGTQATVRFRAELPAEEVEEWTAVDLLGHEARFTVVAPGMRFQKGAMIDLGAAAIDAIDDALNAFVSGIENPCALLTGFNPIVSGTYGPYFYRVDIEEALCAPPLLRFAPLPSEAENRVAFGYTMSDLRLSLTLSYGTENGEPQVETFAVAVGTTDVDDEIALGFDEAGLLTALSQEVAADVSGVEISGLSESTELWLEALLGQDLESWTAGVMENLIERTFPFVVEEFLGAVGFEGAIPGTPIDTILTLLPDGFRITPASIFVTLTAGITSDVEDPAFQEGFGSLYRQRYAPDALAGGENAEEAPYDGATAFSDNLLNQYYALLYHGGGIVLETQTLPIAAYPELAPLISAIERLGGPRELEALRITPRIAAPPAALFEGASADEVTLLLPPVRIAVSGVRGEEEMPLFTLETKGEAPARLFLRNAYLTLFITGVPQQTRRIRADSRYRLPVSPLAQALHTLEAPVLQELLPQLTMTLPLPPIPGIDYRIVAASTLADGHPGFLTLYGEIAAP